MAPIMRNISYPAENPLEITTCAGLSAHDVSGDNCCWSDCEDDPCEVLSSDHALVCNRPDCVRHVGQMPFMLILD